MKNKNELSNSGLMELKKSSELMDDIKTIQIGYSNSQKDKVSLWV